MAEGESGTLAMIFVMGDDVQGDHRQGCVRLVGFGRNAWCLFKDGDFDPKSI